jgi:2-oxoglutarate dehydrogenase E1 component
MLSEAAVLGFEYGYALAQAHGLILWEAQFGDFANNAQSVIDLYITSGESKWQHPNGIVLLLPHGYEGLGPEHSSARLERFLQLCADDNIQVCNVTTPAQYFHLLRRQVKREFRKPLIVMAPKSLLRHPLAVSKLTEMSNGSFKEILDDTVKLKSFRRLLFCSGKIYYDLLKRRQDLKAFDIAVIRLEQFYPFPKTQLEKIVQKYRKVSHWYWVQEEPENMGGWQFIRPSLESIVGKSIKYIGRKAASSPATGFPAIYKMEQAAIVDDAVGPAN